MKDQLKNAVLTIIDRLLDGEKLLLVEQFAEDEECSEWRLQVKLYNPTNDWTRYERFYFNSIIDAESFRHHVVAAAKQITELRSRAQQRNDSTDAIESLILEHATQHVYLDTLYMRLRKALLDAVVRESQGGE